MIGKGVDKKLSEFSSSIKGSFLNIREDMNHISKWVTHFSEKHDSHDIKISEHALQIQALHSKMIQLEDLLSVKSATNRVGSAVESDSSSKSESSSKKDEKEFPGFSISTLRHSQKLMLLAVLNISNEKSGGLISFKEIASDIYPEKDYSKVRSMISETISIFEANSLVKRKRIGKFMFIRVTPETSKIMSALKADPELKARLEVETT